MTERLHKARQRSVIVTASVVGAMALLLLLMGLFSSGPAPDARRGQPVFPGLTENFAEARQIEITLPDGGYTIARTEEQGVWGLVEAGGYPVREDVLAALFDGLAELTYDTARTSDPGKYNSLGLGDPGNGGVGARLTIRDEAGEALVDVIAGRRRDRTYLRMPDSARSWRVTGDLPPLYSRSEWLDLEVIDVAPEEIQSVTMMAPEAGRFEFARTGPEPDDWQPSGVSEGRQPVSRFSIVGPALALSRFAPTGVARFTDMDNPRTIAWHISLLDDGTKIAIESFQIEGDSGWVSVNALEGPRADAINARTAGWLFHISAQDFADFTAPEAAVLRPAED